MKHALTLALCAGLLLATAAVASADELKLKDGTRITGKIVGFEGESFKVETSYGFALVRRDKVASITVSDDAKPPAASSVPPKSDAPKPETAAAPQAQTPAPTPAQPQRAPAPPPEPVNRETVAGTSYINHTYGFQMYKPPSWRVIEGAQRLLPSAIVAMGTNDEGTLMVLGRTQQSGPLDAHVAATDRQLRQVYANYRVLSDQRTTIAGLPAFERRFRGMVDERDWSCVLISFARGSDMFTILGMTAADSDLVQIQENVIGRALASLAFAQPQP
jgi:hypothetical protein